MRLELSEEAMRRGNDAVSHGEGIYNVANGKFLNRQREQQWAGGHGMAPAVVAIRVMHDRANDRTVRQKDNSGHG